MMANGEDMSTYKPTGLYAELDELCPWDEATWERPDTETCRDFVTTNIEPVEAELFALYDAIDRDGAKVAQQ